MKENKFAKIGFIFRFNYGDDTIIYKTLREFNETDDMFDYVENYAKNFVYNFGKKYGKCLFCDVVYNAVPMYTYWFDRNGNVEDTQVW